MIKDNIADQLVYSTARIICTNDSKMALGTGFLWIMKVNKRKLIEHL